MTRTKAVAVLVAVVALAAAHGVMPWAYAQGRRPAAPASVRLYVFDGGTLESDPARYRLTKEDVGTTQLSVAAYLIVHPKGVLLWDTGAVPDDAWSPTGSPVEQRLVLPDGQERRVTIRSALKAQLAASGCAPRDVTHLALSHYHWDHTANANAFAGATWLVRQIERDTMFAEKPLGTATPMTYAALKNSRTTILAKEEHDVFGDGTVILKLAAGHTPGHQVLYVKLAKTGGVLLSGDLYHYPAERTKDRLPTFEFNEEQTRAARRDVDAFLTRTGARLWIQHDLTAHGMLKKAPAYYE
ncbi:MAG TPA: N-acyl homoserine lactonase family protein [Vicinamibacterales bacterium]|nr:N-acyl homoserine lactonase family protein [Vicinamibacterales bacterium]